MTNEERPLPVKVEESTALAVPEIIDAKVQLARAEEAIKFYDGIVTLIARAIPPSQIILYGEEPYFEVGACRRILEWAGVEIQMDVMEQHTWDGEEGPYIEFVVPGRVITTRGRTVSIIGNRATNDDFFGRRTRRLCDTCATALDEADTCAKHGKRENPKRESYQLPLKEVDIPSVRQAAVSNFFNKAVAAIGLKPAMEDLKKAGVNIEALRHVGFERGGAGGRVRESDTGEQARQREEISKLLSELCQADRSKMEALLEELTTFKGDKGMVKGKRRVADLTHKQLPIIVERLRERAKPAGKPAAEQEKPHKKDRPLGIGVVQSVAEKPTRQGGKCLRVAQEGNTLWCFDNAKLRLPNGQETDVFDLLKNAEGLWCEFAVKTREKNGKTFHEIIALVRAGNYEWLDDGTPVVRRDQGELGLEPEEFQGATNEDIPF